VVSTETSAISVPSSVTLTADQTNATIDGNNVSVTAIAGDRIVFIGGTGDTVALSGGTNMITETGDNNTYVLPSAGGGYDRFTTNVLAKGDTLNLKAALAASDWNGAPSTLGNYLTVTNTLQGAELSISATAGGNAIGVATIRGTTDATLNSLLTHIIT
jgi:hypothetical protein